MNRSAAIDAPPTEMSPMCAALLPDPPVTIPNAFCPIVVGPCGLAPAAAGVAAGPYPDPKAPCPVSPMYSTSGRRRDQLDELGEPLVRELGH